jgi:uncharacterized membrane protein
MIVEAIIAWVSGIPPWIATVILSALPVTESRLTIPIAVTVWNMSPIAAYCFAMIGNAIPFIPIFFGFRAVKLWAARHAPWSVQWFERALHRVQRKIGTQYERWGILAVLLFVAVPLPGTGVWSGTLLAVALELSWKRAAFAVIGGMLIMGTIVLGVTLVGRAAL